MMTPPRKPVLLFVAPYFPPACYGGVVQVYLGLLQRLHGYTVVVASEQSDDAAEQQRWDAAAPEAFGFEMRRVTSFEFHCGGGVLGRIKALVVFLQRGRREWRELLDEVRPDIIVCGGTYSAGWLMGWVPPGVVRINYIHGEELTMRLVPAVLVAWMRWRQRICLRRADLNIAVSSYTATLVHRLSGASVEKIKLLPNFIDLNRFKISGCRARLRAARGWNDLVFLTLARLEPRKGIAQTLEAFSRLDAARGLPVEWLYVIAGKGSERQPLEALVKTLGLEEHVQFLGFVPDDEVPALYESADIFVQINREIDGDTEGFGIVYLEASACGLPVVGGIAGGTADAIEEGVSGLRVDGDDVAAIADALQLLAWDEGLRYRMARDGRARVYEGFGVDTAASRFADLLEEAQHQTAISAVSAMHP